jgi:acetaldehyde/propanal dehydrogenase
MNRKIKCALIGPGNIGCDLLAKLRRSPVLEPVWMVGIDPESDGLKRAREMGLKTTADGVDGLLPHVLCWPMACRSRSTRPAPTCMPRTAPS